MNLASLLKKGSLRGLATATPATFATHGPVIPLTVATVATVAVAKAPDRAANDPAQVPAMTNTATVNTPVNTETPVRTKLVRSEVRTETAAIDPVRWTDATAMTGTEIEAFTARLARFTAKGVTHADGEALADKLASRDRDSDDRRLCLECTYLAGFAGTWGCRNWRRAGVALKARDAGLPGDLVRTLQRCDGFEAST